MSVPTTVLSFVGRAWRMAYKITQERGIGAVTGNIASIPIQPLIAAGGLIFVAGSVGTFRRARRSAR